MALLHTSVPRLNPFTACNAKPRPVACLRVKQRIHHHPICAAVLSERANKTAQTPLNKAFRVALAGALASGLLVFSPSPAEADMQMVSPQMVTQMARPLPKQTVDKGKIWSIFIGGAVVLFGITIVAENNETLFPAITRANRAFRMAAKQIDEEEERQKKEEELLRLRQAEYDEEQRQLALVQEGMREARAKVIGSSSSAAQPQLASTAVTPVAAAPAAAPSNGAAAVASSMSPGSHGGPADQVSTSTTAGADPYVVVNNTVPDMGAVAWPAAAAATTPALASTSACAEGMDVAAPTLAVNGAGDAQSLPATGAALSAEEDAEAMARLARLQGFVSGAVAGNKSAMEAYKAQRQ